MQNNKYFPFKDKMEEWKERQIELSRLAKVRELEEKKKAEVVKCIQALSHNK